MEKHAWRLESDTFAEIDSNFFKKFMINDTENYLSILLSKKLPLVNSLLSISSPNDPSQDIKFQITDKRDAPNLDALWAAEAIFPHIDLDSFVIIFLSVFLENSIALIGSNISIITSLIQ